MSSCNDLPADLTALVAKANDAMHFSDQLHKLGVDGAKQLEQCKKLFALGVKIIHLPGFYERLFKSQPGIQAFGDYHIVRAFTGQIHANCKHHSALANTALTTKAKANAAAAEAAVSSAADASTAKPVSSKGKGKATAPKKGKKPPKSKAIVEDTSDDEPATIVLVGIEEDTMMGNADASSANPDTDTVSIPFLAAIMHTADEVIACIQQMSIDNEVEIIVNKDLTAGNIVEGHKVAPKFKKSKVKENSKHQQPEHVEVIFLPYAQVPGMDLNSKDYQLAEAVVVKAAANEATTQARKHPRASNEFSFNDSAYSMASADLVLNNESTKATLALTAKLVTKGGSVNPSETVLRLWESDLRNDIVATIHRIKYLMQYCQFVIKHHSQVLKSLERCIAAEDDACEHCPDHNVSDCFSTTATGYRTE
ncbi:hypothetical protein EDD85DRAFT_962124 [Armillaria nabsnona]|nr:hypothetical protein EDD85DRAFT_962124 [Armillaria nabsnona]